jgi:D-alanyl-lipoteichoic acid acyltransferase DltB (MBOAT superfamily)
VDNQALSRSLVLILVGLTRKLLFANLLFAYIPWKSFSGNPADFSNMEQLGWLVVYSFALYNDFAGYTGIVRGVSGLFGIELSPNFNTPYFSKNFTEFWTRWHISLSQWLRDYIFFPVSRALARRFPNRNGWQNVVIPPMLTMLVSGFWHGPNWQMLLWGGLHGTYLVVERVLILRRPPQPVAANTFWMDWGSRIVTFLFVALAWVPFAMRIPLALNFWKQLFIGDWIGMVDNRLLFALVVLIPSLWLDWAQDKKADETFFLHQNQFVQSALLASVIVALLIVTTYGAGQPFIYQGF